MTLNTQFGSPAPVSMDRASAGTALNGGAYTQRELLGEEVVRIIRKYKERARHLQIPRQSLGAQIAQEW